MKTQMNITGVSVQRLVADRTSGWRIYAVIAACVMTCVIADSRSSRGQGFPVQTASGIQGGLFKHQGGDYRVVKNADYATAADVATADPATIAQIAYNEPCGSCGTSCGGSCGRVSDLSCGPKMTNPCQPCQPYRYGMIEALYMKPDDVSFSPTPGFGVPDFEYEFGTRFTFGSVGNCVNGYEASFTGPFDWDVGNRRTAPLVLDRVIATQPFTSIVGGVAVTGLTNILQETTVSQQAQNLSAEYFSGEVSRTLNSSEFVKFLYGGRYVRYAEDYDYQGIFQNDLQATPAIGGPTQRTLTTTALGVSNEVVNNLIGGQVGLDMLYPISRFAFTDLRMRAGLYANFVDSDFDVNGSRNVTTTPGAFTDSLTPLTRSRSDDDVDLAGIFEIGSGIRYQLGDMLSVRAGVEFWYLSGVATATDRVSINSNGATTRGLKADEDVFFTGLSVGAELRY